MPGSEASSPATTRLRVGIAVISRSTRRMRSARNTVKFSVAGTSAMPITRKSNTLQGSRKKSRRCTMMRAANSATKIVSSTWSMTSSSGPEVAITSCEVSSPSTVALMMMSAMTMRSVFGFSTMVRSQAITVFPYVWLRSSDEDTRGGF